MANLKVRPVEMWAVIIRGNRSRWIFYYGLKATRRDAITEFLKDYVKAPFDQWGHWQERGYTCERVTVSLSEVSK